MRRMLGLMVLMACAGGEVDTDPLPQDCEPADSPSLEFARDLSVGVMTDGDVIAYGTPPQGGAPYAPFQVRVDADVPTGERFPVVATAVTTDTQEEIGTAAQNQAFICSNTGVHAGWRFGGEVHIRFWDQPLEDLEGREITVSLTLDDGSGLVLDAGATGVLSWDL